MSHEAEHKDRQEHHRDTEELDMSDLVMRVQLKDEHVIHSESPQDENVHSHEEDCKNEEQDEAEGRKHKHYLLPIEIVIRWFLRGKQD